MMTGKQFKRIGLGLILSFVLAMLGSGCALTTDSVSLEYASPFQNVAPVSGADKVNVSVKVTDVRAQKDRVSCKKNGYGMEMAAIVSKTDVPAVVSNAITTELRKRGCQVNGGSTQVGVELTKFYNDFKIGFWSGSAVSDVSLNVQVKKPDGNINYAKSIAGTCTKRGVMLCSGANAKLSLEEALGDAISKLMNDEAFTTALSQARL
jgi:uncharacterized lipoprotein YajG